MRELLEQFSGYAVIDILLMAMIIYQLFMFIRGTRAAQMVTGMMLIVGAVYAFSQLYPLTTFNWMMSKFYSSFIIILVILFQEDIRMMLSRMGKKSFLAATETFSSKQILDEVTRAAAALASKRIGALIVLERNIILSRYVDVGILLDSRVSKEILVSIFHPSSPIHDGAVIIQQGRIAAAGCFLPLTRDEDTDPNLGTRHRAGIGISQVTDALVVLVSEEGGSVSLVVDGQVSRGLDVKELRKALRNLLTSSEEQNAPRSSQTTARRGNWSIINRMKIFGSGQRK